MESVHIIKLVVGMESLEQFAQWQKREVVRYDGQRANIARTRLKPARAEEILTSGGSIYRVIKGQIACRQRIIGFEEDDNPHRGKHCLILMDTEIIRTLPSPKRPFQGWRYLKPAATPRDMGIYRLGSKTADSKTEIALMESGLL